MADAKFRDDVIAYPVDLIITGLLDISTDISVQLSTAISPLIIAGTTLFFVAAGLKMIRGELVAPASSVFTTALLLMITTALVTSPETYRYYITDTFYGLTVSASSILSGEKNFVGMFRPLTSGINDGLLGIDSVLGEAGLMSEAGVLALIVAILVTIALVLMVVTVVMNALVGVAGVIFYSAIGGPIFYFASFPSFRGLASAWAVGMFHHFLLAVLSGIFISAGGAVLSRMGQLLTSNNSEDPLDAYLLMFALTCSILYFFSKQIPVIATSLSSARFGGGDQMLDAFKGAASSTRDSYRQGNGAVSSLLKGTAGAGADTYRAGRAVSSFSAKSAKSAQAGATRLYDKYKGTTK